MRLFIALEIPAAARRLLARDAEIFRGLCPRGRFVPPENYHLTLAFLGETDPARLPSAEEALEGCPSSPLLLTAGEPGRFGATLWRSVRGGDDLYSLRDRLYRELRERGFPLEERAYIPHLTLARRCPLPRKTDLNALWAHVPDRSFTAVSAALLRSDPGRSAPVYTPLRRIKFT